MLPFERLIIGTTYDGIAKELLHKLKFERARAASRPIAQVIAGRLAVPFPVTGIVTHVPTAPTRVRQRGYDQSRLIAREIAQRCGLAYSALLRRRGSQRQLGQGRAVRKRQLTGVFWINRDISNKHVILVDDVITTGASVISAATTLRSAGAKSVTVVVFARA
jgi:ComF family protein